MTDSPQGAPPDPRPAGPPRQLDRAPGERYRTPPPSRPAGGSPGIPGGPPVATTRAAVEAAGVRPALPGSRSRALLAGLGTAAVGALVYAALGQIDLGAGLLAVAAFVGWTVALAIVWGAGAVRPIPRQPLVATLLGGGSIVVGLLLAWAWSRVEGGVLGPLEYTDQRYGPIAYLEVVVAGLVAGLRAR